MRYLPTRVMATVIAFGLWLVPRSSGQDAVPAEILQRTFLMKVGNSTGTAFTVDYKGTIYVITARHLAVDLPESKPVFQLWLNNRWEDLHPVRKILPTSADVDIALFETEQKTPQPFQVATAAQGTTLGQQVWFLGYPFGDTAMTSRMENQILPFIKRGTISAINGSNPEAVVLYIDGFNNPGFSGGPIVYWSFNEHAYRILGVVQGFRNDTAKVAVNGQRLDTNVLVNSGILTAYSIKHAIDAIEAAQKKLP